MSLDKIWDIFQLLNDFEFFELFLTKIDNNLIDLLKFLISYWEIMKPTFTKLIKSSIKDIPFNCDLVKVIQIN